MSQSHVSVNINGRQYRMACDEGQEQHLQGLAADLDQRIATLRGNFGEIGDMRLTVMAALLMVDEIAETGARLRRCEEEIAALKDAGASAAERTRQTHEAIAAAFNAAAERIEKVARTLGRAEAKDVPAG
jgi:cell division protein ZapA